MLDVISSTNSSTNAVISGSDYSVNAIGQRTGISRSGSATPASASATYGYNNRGELITADEATNAQDRAYQFDGIGNRQKTVSGSLTLPGSNNHSVNALNQYTNIPNLPATPSYDDDGNATAYPLPVNTAANAALTYDGENRLIKVVTGSTTVEYIYDSFSRRVAKTVGSTRTYYVYNGWNCVAEYTGAVHTTGAAPTPTPTYTHTWGIDLSGSMQGAGGVGGLLQTTAHGSLPTHHYPIYDGNGNITAYIDNTCSVQASFDYDPFGNIVNNNNPQNFPYAFSTKPREPETGLYYYGYRFYDPNTGRWLNRDPRGESGGKHLYGFVGNNGIFQWDLLGLEVPGFLPRAREWPVPTGNGNVMPDGNWVPHSGAVKFIPTNSAVMTHMETIKFKVTVPLHHGNKIIHTPGSSSEIATAVIDVNFEAGCVGLWDTTPSIRKIRIKQVRKRMIFSSNGNELDPEEDTIPPGAWIGVGLAQFDKLSPAYGIALVVLDSEYELKIAENSDESGPGSGDQNIVDSEADLKSKMYKKFKFELYRKQSQVGVAVSNGILNVIGSIGGVDQTPQAATSVLVGSHEHTVVLDCVKCQQKEHERKLEHDKKYGK